MTEEPDISVLGGYQFVKIGEVLDLSIIATDMTDMRAFDAAIFYDPNALRLEGEAKLGKMFKLGDPTTVVGDWAIVQNPVQPGYLRIAAYTAQGDIVGTQELMSIPFRGVLVIPDLPQVYTPVRIDAYLHVGQTQTDTETYVRRVNAAIKVQPRQQRRAPMQFPHDPD